MPFDREKMEILMESGKTMKEISEELGVSPSTLREYRHVIDQRDDHTIDHYLERIRDVMEDRDLSETDDPERYQGWTWRFNRHYRSRIN